MKIHLVHYIQYGRTPQERMSNIHMVYGNTNAKYVTKMRNMVRSLQETGPRSVSLPNDA
jgi:hypothetical protein